MDDAAVDFAVAAWREDGLWQVELLPPRTGENLEGLVNALRAQPGEGGVLGLVSVAEEFFLLVRVLGEEVRLLLSDVYAAEEWPLGLDALERLGIPSPEDDESDDPQPAGTCASSTTSASARSTSSSSSTTRRCGPTSSSPPSPRGSASASTSTPPSNSSPTDPMTMKVALVA